MRESSVDSIADAGPEWGEYREPPSRVLIVEDERIVAADLRHRLEAMGYTVSGVAASGEEALRRTRREAPHVLLIDIGLEGNIDGIEAARTLRSTSTIPFIFVTAYSDELSIQRAQATSPTAYITKPFDDYDLRSALDLLKPAALPQHPEPAAAEFHETASPDDAGGEEELTVASQEPNKEETTAPEGVLPMETATVETDWEQAVQRTTFQDEALEAEAVPQEAGAVVLPNDEPGHEKALEEAMAPHEPVTLPECQPPPARERMRNGKQKPHWRYAGSFYQPRRHCLLYRDDDLGVQMQLITKTSGFFAGRAKRYYFIDGTNKVCRSERKLVSILQNGKRNHPS